MTRFVPVAGIITSIVQDKNAAYPPRRYPWKGRLHTMSCPNWGTDALEGVLFGLQTSEGDDPICPDPHEEVAFADWERSMDANASTKTYIPKNYSIFHLVDVSMVANALEKGKTLKKCQADTAPSFCYVGELKEGIPQGYGVCVYDGGIVYEGGWRDGKCTENVGALKGTKGKTLPKLLEVVEAALKIKWRAVRRGYG